MCRKYKGFTILEMVIVLAIIAGLTGILIYYLKPTEIFKKARDTRRIADLNSLDYIINSLIYEDPSINLGATNTVYLSLPMDIATTNCKAQYTQLPDLPSGWSYYCVPRASTTNIDGTGWIPINFSAYKVVNIQKLPTDPLNTPSYFYTYVAGGGYEITAALENTEANYNITSQDGGDNDYIYEIGSDKTLTPLAVQVRGLMPGFAYKREIYINSQNSLTDYQILITLDTQTLISNNKMKSDCSDIRFTDSDGKTLLNFWLEPQSCNATNTRIWVKIPQLNSNATKTIILYYGNKNAGSISNGYNTFLAFNIKSSPLGTKPIAFHNLYFLANESLYSNGYNGMGQLGIGVLGNYPYPIDTNLSNATSVAGGFWHSCAVKSDGTAWCWGYNGHGELGNGTTNNTSTPVQVSGITNAVAISAGYYHTCALLNDGTVKCWGYNAYGQLGDGTTINRTTPVTTNFSLGARFDKTNGIYSIPNLNDIYFIRKYSSIEPNVTIGQEQTNL